MFNLNAPFIENLKSIVKCCIITTEEEDKKSQLMKAKYLHNYLHLPSNTNYEAIYPR